jgi:hypothetical protein
VNPPSHGNPPLTSAATPATKGNIPTAAHPDSAGPHPPIDATHKTERVVALPNPVTNDKAPLSNRLKQLEKGHLSDITNMLSYSYSDANSFIVVPSTEEDDPHSSHQHQQNLSATPGDNKLEKELKKDQAQLDKLNHRRDYIYKKIARGLVKRGAAWGLYDNTNTHLVAAAILIPPVRQICQNTTQLRLEDPNINEGHAEHYMPLANLFSKKNPKQLLLLGPSLIKRIRLELRLFDTAMTIHQRPDVAFLYFFGDTKTSGHPAHADPNGPADKSLSQHPNPMPALAENEPQYSQSVSTLLEELGKRYPMQVNAQRYRDNQRFVLLLQNGFQEIDKVQGFHQRKEDAEAHAYAPGMGHKETHTHKGPDVVYESCFIALTKGIYPSLKSVENDVRGVVAQKEAQGVISNPTTVLPPASVPSTQPHTVDHPIRAPPTEGHHTVTDQHHTTVPSKQTHTTEHIVHDPLHS